MKKYYRNLQLLIPAIVLVFTCSKAYTQSQSGLGCDNPRPFTVQPGNPLIFPAQVGGNYKTQYPGNNYSCLGTGYGSMWFYFQTKTPGNISFKLSGNGDIDFIVWGPFSSLTAAISRCNSYSEVPASFAPSGSNSGNGRCSYSSSATEYVGITLQNPGEVYIILIDNYAGRQMNITAELTGGPGELAFLPEIYDVAKTNISDCGLNNGAIRVDMRGGTPPYRLTINGANEVTPPVLNATERTYRYTYTGLAAGNYLLKVVDSKGESTTRNEIISQPGVSSLNAKVTTDVDNCGLNGQVTLTASGGSGNYEYSANGTSYQASNIITGVTSGVRTFYVRDKTYMSCVASTTITVNGNTPVTSIAVEQSEVAICPPANVTLKVKSPIAGITYTWYDAASGGNVVGTGSSLTLNYTATADKTYYVTACNLARVPVVVRANPIPALSSALTATVCNGSTFSYTATSSVANTTFSWSRAASGGNSATSGSGASINHTLVNATTAPINVVYTFTLTSPAGCTSKKAVTVTVNPTPKLSNASKVISPICSGATASYTATSATTGTTYTWSRPAVTGITEAAKTNIAGAAISEVLTNTTTAPITVTYIYTLTANGCTNKENVTVVVNPIPKLSNASKVISPICSGATASYTATSATTGTTYTWSRPAVTGITEAAKTNIAGAAISEVLTNTTTAPITVTYTYTLTANGCTNKENVTVVVNPIPKLSNASKVISPICSGATASYTATSATTGTTYTWSRPAVTGITEAAKTNIAGAAISEVLTNTTTAPITVTYTYTLSANGCTNKENVTVVVNPIPKLSNASKVISPICSGATASYTATSATTGATYTWSRPAVTGISEAAKTNIAGAAISEVLTNTTTAPITVTYTYTLLANGCTNKENVTVVVNPLPVPTISGDLTPCKGSRQTYSTEAGMSAYTWTVTGGTIVSGQNTKDLVVDWSKTAGTTAKLTVTYTNTNGCKPTAASEKTVTIANVTAPTITGEQTVFGGSTWTYTTESGKFDYTWTVTGGTITSGGTTSSISVKWDASGTGTVKVSYRNGSTTGCYADMPTPLNVTIVGAALSFTITPATIKEGETATATISLPAGTKAPTGGLTFTLSDNGSTAIGTDYKLSGSGISPANLPAAVSIATGQSTVSFTIEALNDFLMEKDEVLKVKADNAGFPTVSNQLTIKDQTDGTIAVEKYKPASSNAAEPNVDGSFRIHFKDTRVTTTYDIPVMFSITGDSGAYEVGTGSDVPTAASAIIRAGKGDVEVPIRVKNNYVVEGERKLTMTISMP